MTFSNVMYLNFSFCLKYRSERDEYDSLAEFFRDYDIPVLSGRNTCVGLSSDLLSRLSELESKYPGFKDSVFPVSTSYVTICIIMDKNAYLRFIYIKRVRNSVNYSLIVIDV